MREQGMGVHLCVDKEVRSMENRGWSVIVTVL